MIKTKSISEIEKIQLRLDKYTIHDFLEKYSEKKSRIFINCGISEIVKFWEIEFDLDYGEPECFMCKIRHKSWSKLQRAHIIAASFGGPAEPWNIVLLCPHCHRVFDKYSFGYHTEYKKDVEWLKNYYSNILVPFFKNEILNHVESNKIDLENFDYDLFLDLIVNKVLNLKSNKYLWVIDDPIYDFLGNVKYALDEVNCKNK